MPWGEWLKAAALIGRAGNPVTTEGVPGTHFRQIRTTRPGGKVLTGIRSSLLAFSCVLALTPHAAAAQDVGLFLGAKFPDNDYGVPIGTQPELRVSAAIGPASWWLKPVAFLAGSYGREVATVWPPFEDYVTGKFEMAAIETGLGGRRTFGEGDTRVYVEGGLELAFLQGRSRTSWWTGPTSRSQALGAWAGAGVSWPIDGGFRLGVSGRFSAVESKGSYISGGGIHLGLDLLWSGKR